jgi:hypothetical protein
VYCLVHKDIIQYMLISISSQFQLIKTQLTWKLPCPMYLLTVLFCVLFVCKCVLCYCHRVSTQLQLANISVSMYRQYSISLSTRRCGQLCDVADFTPGTDTHFRSCKFQIGPQTVLHISEHSELRIKHQGCPDHF